MESNGKLVQVNEEKKKRAEDAASFFGDLKKRSDEVREDVEAVGVWTQKLTVSFLFSLFLLFVLTLNLLL